MATEGHHFHWHFDELDDENFKIHGRTVLLIVVLFCVLLGVLICLYTKWIFFYRNLHQIHRHFRPPISGCQATGLSMEAIASIPVELHRSSEVIDADCSICLSSFINEEKVKVLPDCHHMFHPECVDRWLMTHASCPLCRSPLKPAFPGSIV